MTNKLIVWMLDDDKDLTMIFQQCFSTKLIEITTFNQPELFIEKIKTFSPDIVFIDYRMPNLSGFDVVKNVPSNIKKVLLTGELDIDYKDYFDEIFYKPYKFDAIINLLNDCLIKK